MVSTLCLTVPSLLQRKLSGLQLSTRHRGDRGCSSHPLEVLGDPGPRQMCTPSMHITQEKVHQGSCLPPSLP